MVVVWCSAYKKDVDRSQGCGQKPRMGTEAKAKVIASILGGKFVQFLAALYCFASVDLEETVEFKKFNKFCPQIDETTFALASLSILLLCVMRLGIPSCFGDANK